MLILIWILFRITCQIRRIRTYALTHLVWASARLCRASVHLCICASAPTSVEFLKNPQPQHSTAFNTNGNNNNNNNNNNESD